MNPVQMAQQIKRELARIQWDQRTNSLVFAPVNVVVTADLPREDQIPASFPWAIVSIGDGDPDPDDPDLLTQRFSVSAAVSVLGDPMGEFAVIGSSVSTLGDSPGRGIGEVMGRVRKAVQSLTGADGAPMILSMASTGTPGALGGGRHVVVASDSVEAVCTAQASFTPPYRITYDGARWAWHGADCEARFDFFRYRLVAKLGTEPSATPDDGTVIYTGTDRFYIGAATTGYAYTAFADYAGRGNDLVDGSSPPDVGSFLVNS